MGTVVKPYTFSIGAVISAAQFNNDFDTLYNEFNGNIDNANIKVGAGIEGTKIASDPNGIDTAQINDDAVTAAKLRSDAVTDANRAVTSDHIRDDAIIASKIPSDPTIDGNRTIVGDHVKNNTLPMRTIKGLVVEAINFDIGSLPSSTWQIAVHDVVRKVTGSNYTFAISVIVAFTGIVGGDVAQYLANGNSQNLTPVTAIPTASKYVISAYVTNPVYNSPAGHFTGTLIVTSADIS